MTSQALQSGYNSHYVAVRRTGEVAKFPEDRDSEGIFDEIVINQESQICPVYLLKLDPTVASKLLDKWSRERPHRNASMAGDDFQIPLMDMDIS